MGNSIVFHEHKKRDISGYTLIEGFPGMGLVGTIAAKYIVEKLDLELLGHIESDAFVPIIRVHNGYPVFPSRIYLSKKHKIVVLISEQIISPVFTSQLAKEVVSWVKKKKIASVISLSGIKSFPGDAKTIYGIASNSESRNTLKKYGVEIIKDGITSGITALIMLNLKDEKIDAVSLMGNVEVAADYKAASGLIEKLNQIYSLNIDTKPLEKEARETEQALLKNLEELKKVAQKDRALEEKTITGPQMYT